MVMAYKPGEVAPRSGEYELVGPRGGKTGETVTLSKNDRFPPSNKAGQVYEMLEKNSSKSKKSN